MPDIYDLAIERNELKKKVEQLQKLTLFLRSDIKELLKGQVYLSKRIRELELRRKP